MDKLPIGWKIITLNEISNRITKGSTPTTYGYSFQKSGINFVKVENLNSGFIDVASIHNFISNDAHESQKRSQLERNDLLFSIAGTIGTIAIVRESDLPANTNQAIAIIRGYENYSNPYYLKYVLSSGFSDKTKEKARGGALQNISLEDIKSLTIPLPPLPEQTRIVNKLDRLFERIDKSIALLDENIKHTEALMASVLDEVLTSSKESIEISKLVVKAENINPQNNPETIYTYIDISSVNNKTHIIENPSELQGKDAPSRARKSVVKGDIVFATTRPNLRNIAVVDSDYINPIASTGFCVLRANFGANKDFLFLCLLSNNIQEQIKPFIRGAQYPAISDKDLLQCKIPKLNIEEQIKVSEKVMRIREKLALLMSEQQSKLSYFKALKASLLDKAFKGEL